jgi:cobalt-precorrin 5A hydrolase/precorrin-3B C17-methyltransferase
VNSKLMKDEKLHYYIRDGIGPVPFPDYYENTGDTDRADVIIDYGTPLLSAGQVQLVPPCLVAGIGCRKGTPSDSIKKMFEKVLRNNSLDAEAIREIRTIGEKMEEPGLLEAAEEMGIPVIEVSRGNILAQEGPFTPSAADKYFGIPGVAEPCAASAGPLIVPRAACGGVTAAISLDYRSPRGMLWIVGTGPGNKVYLTYQAGSKLQEADTVIGYRLYVDLLPEEYLNGKRVERYGMGEEEMRVKRAVSLAEAGHRVALISGGDPILFGLAALALRHAGNRTGAEVIPGLSAVQVAGSRMGAPYTNGLVMLSLSDYLQPWNRTMKALEGAASMEMTVALYNPVKRDLDKKLAFVRKAFGSHPGREIFLAGNAGRRGETFRKMKLEDLSPADVDMRTMILIPGKDTEEIGGTLMDKRGYTSEGKGGTV